MYLALYRKWRPKTFDDVISQNHITKTLKNEVKHHKTAHAYLFTGARGTGKTSCSKILAMAINCLEPQDGNPCMQCSVCKGILDGTILDVLEIDAASNNGVDDVRILREEANYLPTQCQYRVYIIDETHMLSISAFNALLKIMEEPPPHVKFILATTEVHKVPATVVSRCQRFDFHRVHTQDIANRLLDISEQEAFTLDDKAAFLIARLADGGMRDAFSILDQCIAYSNQVTVEIVSQATGLVLRDYLFEITDLLQQQDCTALLNCIDNLYHQSKDLQKLVSELIEHFRNLMIVKTTSQAEQLIQALPEELERLKVQSNTLSIQTILRGIGILQECLDKIGKNYDKRLSVEMALIKLSSPQLDDASDALLERIQALEDRLDSGVLQKAKPVVEPVPLPQQIEVQTEPVLEPPPVPMNQVYIQSQPQKLDSWSEMIGSFQQSDPALFAILSGSAAYTIDDKLLIDSPNSFLSTLIKRNHAIKKLLQLLEEKTGRVYRIIIKKSKSEQKQDKLLEEIEQTAFEMGIDVENH